MDQMGFPAQVAGVCKDGVGKDGGVGEPLQGDMAAGDRHPSWKPGRRQDIASLTVSLPKCVGSNWNGVGMLRRKESLLGVSEALSPCPSYTLR